MCLGLVVLYHFCSNKGHGVQNAFRPGVMGLNHRNTEKNIEKFSSSKPLGLGAWNLVYSLASFSFTKFVQMKVPGFKWPYARRLLVWTTEIHRKYSKIFFFRIAMLTCLKFGMKLWNVNEIHFKVFYLSPSQLSKRADPGTLLVGYVVPEAILAKAYMQTQTEFL